MGEVIIRQARHADLEKISFYIKEFSLDGENIDSEQFIVAEIDNNLTGFGRIKPYENMYELSSIGVLEEYRRKGIGEKIVRHLIDIFPVNQVWIATRKPDYFGKFGFKESLAPPEELIGKSQRVCMSVCHPSEGMAYMVLEK